MNVEINGSIFEIENETVSIEKLILNFNLDLKSTAVALNREIIPKSRYKDTMLCENDCLDLVSIAPGG